MSNQRLLAFKGRTPRSTVHPRAMQPRTLREPTPEEMQRGVAIAYSVAQFTVYRGVIDRLAPGELFRMETRQVDYEMSAGDFAREFRAMSRTPSYSTGTPSMPNGCYYTVSGVPPSEAAQFRVPR